MVRLKEEFRILDDGSDAEYCVLTRENIGMTLDEYVAYYGPQENIGGFDGIVDTIHQRDKLVSLPVVLLGVATAIAGCGLFCFNERGQGVLGIAAGISMAASGVLRRHTSVFRDASGNEADLFLGTIRVAGTKEPTFIKLRMKDSVDGEQYQGAPIC